MAESVCKKNFDSKSADSAGDKNEDFGVIECAVCLQNSIHPSKLPCGHIFCYLCVKGIVNQGRRCAICRQYIPVDYLDKPKLLKPEEVEKSCKGFDDGHLWFYEGRNGWWQYDERSSQELEIAYQKGERCCELLIAGYLYVADFDSMLQYRRNDPPRKRRIKRDLATISALGVAGLKTSKTNDASQMSTTATLLNVLAQDLQNLQISNSAINSSQHSSDILPSSNLNPTPRYDDNYLEPEFCHFSGWSEESSDDPNENDDIYQEIIYFE